jgi:hypothetical protein
LPRSGIVALSRGYGARWRDFERRQLLRAWRDLVNHKYFRRAAEEYEM